MSGNQRQDTITLKELGELTGISIGNVTYSPDNISLKKGQKYYQAHIHEPDPIGGDKVVLNLVIDDLKTRAIEGEKKYGTTNNGRNALMDAYQEALDLCMYLRQALEEQASVSTK